LGTARSSTLRRPAGGARVDRLGGVAQQVHQHLLDQDRVDQQLGRRAAT
jgi:hypothetical protein